MSTRNEYGIDIFNNRYIVERQIGKKGNKALIFLVNDMHDNHIKFVEK